MRRLSSPILFGWFLFVALPALLVLAVAVFFFAMGYRP